MADHRMRNEWAQTSSILAMLANGQRDPKTTRAYRPSDFNPLMPPTTPPRVDVSVLKDVFIHGRVPPALLAER